MRKLIIFIGIILLNTLCFTVAFSQTWTLDQLVSLKQNNDSLKKVLDVININIENIKQKITDDSLTLFKSENDLKVEIDKYNKKAAKSLNEIDKKNLQIRTIITQQKQTITKLESNNRINLDTIFQSDFADSIRYSKEKQEMVDKIKELETSRSKHKQDIETSNKKMFECIIESYNSEVENLNKMSEPDGSRINDLSVKRSQILSLGVNEISLSKPDRYSIYFNGVNSAKKRLQEQCNNTAINSSLGTLNSLLADKNLTYDQKDTVQIYRALLENYPIVVGDINKQINRISGWFGTTLSNDALTDLKTIETNIKYKDYPFLLDQLKRLKDRVTIKNGANDHLLKCIN